MHKIPNSLNYLKFLFFKTIIKDLQNPYITVFFSKLMENEADSIKQFIIKFFENLQSTVIEKGNYLLKTISNFLEEQGSTTLLKINFDIDFEKEIKKRIKLNNCQIEKLIQEIERINRHFIQETQELKNNLKKSTKKTEKEINEELEKKINEFEKDKERAINIEKQKHSLNLNTKLFNTTLIYYPVLNYDCYLINEHGKRIIEVSFDPLTKELKQIFCESCEDKIETINLCSSGHIICNKCLIKCNSCNITYCNKCLNIICESCKKKICKKCAIRCNNCSKVMCKDHAIYDKVTDKCYCSSCLKLCERCQHKKESNRFKTSQKTGAEICEDCYRLEMQQKTLKEIFKK